MVPTPVKYTSTTRERWRLHTQCKPKDSGKHEQLLLSYCLGQVDKYKAGIRSISHTVHQLLRYMYSLILKVYLTDHRPQVTTHTVWDYGSRRGLGMDSVLMYVNMYSFNTVPLRWLLCDAIAVLYIEAPFAP